MDEALAAKVMANLHPAPFFNHVGAQLRDCAEGRAVITVFARDEFGRSGNNPDGAAHGGIIATTIDMAASCALITTLKNGESRTTIDLSVHYLAPAIGEMRATATVRRRGGRTAVIDVELETDEGLAAIGRATFAILRS